MNMNEMIILERMKRRINVTQHIDYKTITEKDNEQNCVAFYGD